MENKDKCESCGSGDCKNTCGGISNCMNGHCNHGGCRWIKKLLVLFVILMAFWLGECVGELKGEIRANYRHEYGNMMYKWDRPMMGGYYNTDTNTNKGTDTAPEAPAKAN